MRTFLALATILCLGGVLAACATETDSGALPTADELAAEPATKAAPELLATAAADGHGEEASPAPDANWPIRPYDAPHVVITLVGGGEVVVELHKDEVPKTVENFIRLAEQKFYDGTLFHRVIPGFMAQGGSPEGKGMGGPGWSIDLEIHPSLRHVRGSMAMARKPDPNSAGSQFYICYAPKASLDDEYAVFGTVVSGMDAVDGLKYGSTNRSEMRQHGWDGPEDGYPSAIETVRIVDGRP
jgi:cyclophilin family peptidyl-prolyl cis-trans isomerase